LNGRVASVGASSFVLSVSGRHYTCTVTGSTQWTGVANGIGTSSPLRADLIASVQGTMQTDGTFTASIVTTQLDH
jgi:hypothetical protein